MYFVSLVLHLHINKQPEIVSQTVKCSLNDADTAWSEWYVVGEEKKLHYMQAVLMVWGLNVFKSNPILKQCNNFLLVGVYIKYFKIL